MKVYVHGNGKTPDLADLPDTAVLGESVGLQSGEKLWVEDTDEPLPDDATTNLLGTNASAVLHRGRGLVEVEVSYNGSVQHRDFGPGTTVDRVFDWATGKDGFGLDPVAAADLVLRLPGSEEDLNPSAHIGTLVEKQERLTLNLLPASRFAG